MTGIYEVMRTAILADATIPALINSNVHLMLAPDNQKPPFIVLSHEDNFPLLTGGATEIDLPNIALDVYVSGSDWVTLKSIVDALLLLFKSYNTQSGGKSYLIERRFDREMLDEDRSLRWNFEYRVTITES